MISIKNSSILAIGRANYISQSKVNHDVEYSPMQCTFQVSRGSRITRQNPRTIALGAMYTTTAKGEFILLSVYNFGAFVTHVSLRSYLNKLAKLQNSGDIEGKEVLPSWP